jgi:hypothetical protein
MDGFSVLNEQTWRVDEYADTPEYQAGNAFGWLYRGNKQAATNHLLVGRLYVAKSGWLLLSVPNALVRGVYDALSAPGAELPKAGLLNVPNVDADIVNAHISVMNADEVAKIGPENINERGHMFGYSLGTLKEISPRNIDGISKVWAIQVSSPELSAIRRTYGLSPLLNDHQFHITVAVRRKKVLQDNAVSKAAADDKLSRSVKNDVLPGGKADNLPDREFSPVALADSVKNDVLPGGKADNLPDREFSPVALAEGAKHEHEHTGNDQAAKEIAKDHLSEDAHYYEKIKEIEKASHADVLAQLRRAKEHSDKKQYALKAAILRQLMEKYPNDWVIDDPKPRHKGVTHTPTNFRFHTDPTAIPAAIKTAENVYMNQLRNMYSLRRPITYDYNKPVFENVRDQLMEVKRRGDWMIQARRNHDLYMGAISPQHRYQLAMKAMRGEMAQPSFVEQTIENYGDNALNTLFGPPKK